MPVPNSSGPGWTSGVPDRSLARHDAAGMAEMCEQLTAETGILAIDGVTAAVTLAGALIASGCRTSKLGAYALPLPKRGGLVPEAA